jgi:hypothetical protein
MEFELREICGDAFYRGEARCLHTYDVPIRYITSYQPNVITVTLNKKPKVVNLCKDSLWLDSCYLPGATQVWPPPSKLKRWVGCQENSKLV